MYLNERVACAAGLHKEGYNCAQSVLLSFSDLTGLARATASRMAMGLGGGVGGQGQVCGVVLGMSLVLGLLRGDDPAGKGAAYAEVRELTRRFREKNDGHWLCRDLKVQGRRPCDDLIADGVEILYSYLAEERK